jgi:lipid-binding SYLF domain-containing protein
MKSNRSFVSRIVPVVLLTLLTAGPALAINKAEVDQRIRKLTAKFESLQAKPEKRIPAETLKRAQAIVLLDRTKAGFIFAFQGGNGVALVRDPKTRNWGPPAFFSASEASLGFQIGGQQSFVVMLLMNTNSVRVLTESNVEFGGEASGTAGQANATAEGTVSEQMPSVLTYTEKGGLYGGASLKGGGLAADKDSIAAYYDDYLTVSDIIYNNKLKTTDAYNKLVEKVEAASKK